jgi:hypothetical protein
MIQKASLLFIVLVLTVSVAYAQTDWEQELGEELVETRDDKMVIEDYFLYRINVEGFDERTLQTKIYGEAPTDGILSRDKFLSLTTLVSYQTLMAAFADSYQLSASEFWDAVEIEDLADPIGTPDIELNLIATDQGIQIELVNTATDQRRRFTTTWKEMYAN